MKSKAIALALALLWLTVIAVFWRALFTSDVPFFRDVSMAHVPRLIELRNLVSGGQWPFWNPFEHFGEPVAVNPNYLLFYPTTWIGWLLPPVYAFKLHYVLHFLLGATGSFLLARRLKLPASCCFLAGGLFVFAGPVISLGNFYNTVATVAWVPLVLLAADYHAERGGLKGAGALAAAMTFQTLSGEPVTALATAVLALGWMLACYGEFRGALHSPANRKVFTRFLLAGLLAAGFSAIQVLPAFRHLFLTERGALDRSTALYWSLLPIKIVEMLVPDFWGNQLDASSPWVYIEGGQPYLLLSVFVGIIPLALAFRTAISCDWSIRRLILIGRLGVNHDQADRVAQKPRNGFDRLADAQPKLQPAVRFWLLAAVILLILALGRYTPIWYPLYYVLPLFRLFRFPVKFVSLLVLCVAQLAAIGLASLLKTENPGSISQSGLRGEHWLRAGLVSLGSVWLAGCIWIIAMPQAAARVFRAFAGYFFDPAVALRLRQTLVYDRVTLVRGAADWLAFTIPSNLPYVLGSSAIAFATMWPGLRDQLRRKLAYTTATLALVQLIAAHVGINPLVSRRLYDDRPPVVRYMDQAMSAEAEKAPATGELRVATLPARLFVESQTKPATLLPKRFLVDIDQLDFLPSYAQAFYIGRQNLQGGVGTFGLEGTFGYDTERLLSKQQGLVNGLGSQVMGNDLVRLLQLTSVDYAVLVRLDDAPGLEKVGVFPNYTPTPARLYRVRNALPRAYLVPASGGRWLPSGTDTLLRLRDPAFDASRHVLLDSDSLAGSTTSAASPPGFAETYAETSPSLEAGGKANQDRTAGANLGGEALIVERNALRVVVETKSAGQEWLVLNDSYNPDWKAAVDGQPSRVWRANQIFRAVLLPPGNHRVTFIYRPSWLFAGAIVTGFTLLGYFLGLAVSTIQRRRYGPLPVTSQP